jgi:uncharacterized protein (TIGR02646 family)
MIQIRKSNLNDLVQYHFDSLKLKLENDFPNNCKYSLKTILTAKPEKLDEIVKWYDTLEQEEKIKYKYIKNRYDNFSTKKDEYNAYDLMKDLNIKSCPYCNRNYTFTVVDEEDELLRADIDHFYEKSEYPILALSFYNLIPSCLECNRTLKGSSPFKIDTHIHPYSDDFNFKVKFDYRYTSANKIKIDIKSKDPKAINSIKDLKLKEIYNEGYTDIVQELIQKSQIYNESYIDELYQNYEGTLFKNREDLLRLINCGYINDEDIDKRPLSKLIKDISEELELI